MVRIDTNGAKEFLPEGSLAQKAQSAIDMLKNGTGAGSDFIGWVDLPVSYDKEEFSRIQKAAKKIQSDSRALVVIGIGGSYLGARAVIELLRSPNYNMLQKSTPDIYFAGNGISSDALSEIIAMIGDRDFSVNVISKSGTTTEPAIAFRIFKEMLEKKYGKEGARERIYATTDKAKGALKTLATKEGYETFVVPDNVGGRYSVLTAVGLLPIAVSGIDIEKLMQGAAEQREEALSGGVQSVEAQYAMNRQMLSNTGKAKGALKTLATKEGYETFVVPDNVGGRYSVLTAVGLLPIAVSGIDIEKLMQGAAEQREEALSGGVQSVEAQYAMNRQLLSSTGKHVEILAAYEPSFRFMAEWWKQLYGESEGKDQTGIFPASVDLTPDLHSMGQYMQEGRRMLQETVVFFDKARTSVAVPSDEENLDGLNYLAGREMSYINEKAMQATKAAHISGGVPVTEIRLPEISEQTVGALIYFFEYACGVSGYISGVNPFNQPGVEAYKKNMFHLLGKPGY